MKPLKYFFLTCDGIGLPIAHRLLREGQDVTVCQLDSKEKVEKKTEDPEVKRRRMSLYENIIEKVTWGKFLSLLKSADKETAFVVCDFNDIHEYAKEIIPLGLKGFYPTKELFELESDRDAGKEFVKKHYTSLKVGEVHEFKSAQDGIDFLEESEDNWVLKGYSPDAKTLVPHKDDPEQNKAIICDALTAHAPDYESQGYILEKRVENVIELTPEIVFYNGKPVFTTVDIENKSIGCENHSIQTGCMQNLVFHTKLTDEINKIAFPQIVYDMAKKHPGMFVYDASILYSPKEDELYFGEFCAQRWGFDAIFTEIQMSASAHEFFENIVQGKDPIIRDFGAAVRVLNMHKDDGEHDRRVLEGVSMEIGDTDSTWVFECKKDDNGTYVSTGLGWDLAVFTGCGDALVDAVDEAYDACDAFAFEDAFCRPKTDFLSRNYNSSILNRFEWFNHDWYDLPDYTGD